MLGAELMEVVLETEDYQNFFVRSVPATLSSGAALTGSRILHLSPAGPDLYAASAATDHVDRLAAGLLPDTSNVCLQDPAK